MFIPVTTCVHTQTVALEIQWKFTLYVFVLKNLTKFDHAYSNAKKIVNGILIVILMYL